MRVLLFLLCCTYGLQAQDAYTYLTDRKFETINELVGYTFVPSKLEMPGGQTTDLEPDTYAFGITAANLYVRGADVEGVYNINNMIPEKYGYKIVTMNARNPMQQGHLKVIIDEDYYVNALIFKKDSDADQIIFYLADKTKKQVEQERAFFTEIKELVIPSADSIWGATVHPFFQTNIQNHQQQRLWAKDSTAFEFIQVIEIEKNDKKRSKDPEEFDRLVSLKPEELVTEDRKLVKKLGFSIKQTNSIKMRSRVPMENGSKQLVEEELKVAELVELEDSEAGKEEDKYMIELKTNKGPFYIYVRGDRSVSGIEFQNLQFDMMEE